MSPSIDPLRVLLKAVQAGARPAAVHLADAWAAAVAVALGGATSGAAVARVLGVSPSTGKRLVRAYQAALGASGARGPSLGTPEAPSPVGAAQGAQGDGSPVSAQAVGAGLAREPDGPPMAPPAAHPWPPTLGGKGGGIGSSLLPEDQTMDYAPEGQGRKTAGAARDPLEAPPGPYAGLPNPPELARSTAAAWLGRRSLAPEAVRRCMAELSDRWLIHRAHVRSPTGWALRVVQSIARELYGMETPGARGLFAGR